MSMSGSLTNQNTSLFLKVQRTIWSLKQCRSYLQPAVYSSTFGDAMLLGLSCLSNVLCLPIAVFTSIESRSYIPIHPQSPPVDINPILLTFLHVGPGHFSLAVRKETLLQQLVIIKKQETATNDPQLLSPW